MSLLTRLNKPIFAPDISKNYMTSSRSLDPDDILRLNQELDLLSKNSEIIWMSYKTYLPSLVCLIIASLIFNSVPISIFSFFIGFILLNVIPFFVKGDSFLLKKDLAGGVASIKTGPVIITEDDYGGTYMKRVYLDDVIVDGIYTKDSILKYPQLINGQNIEVTYSPNAQFIFSVRSL